MYEGDYKFRRRVHFCLLSLSLDVIHILQYRTISRESSVLEWVAAIINNDKCWKLTHTLSLSLFGIQVLPEEEEEDLVSYSVSLIFDKYVNAIVLARNTRTVIWIKWCEHVNKICELNL
jgi:hypothetical protein